MAISAMSSRENRGLREPGAGFTQMGAEAEGADLVERPVERPVERLVERLVDTPYSVLLALDV